MASAPRRVDDLAHSLEHALRDNLRQFGGLRPNELVTHFELVVQTRRVDDDGIERSERYHWAPIGSDWHMSYGILEAQAQEILQRINARS